MRIDSRPINRQAPNRGNLRFTGTPSEFEVQAFLWAELTRLNYWVRGEVSAHGGQCRCDLVIFEKSGSNFLPIRIIEVKLGRRNPSPESRCGRQVDLYYERYGLPVDVVGGMSEARQYIRDVEAVLPPALATGPHRP